jgi:hypothetical protein
MFSPGNQRTCCANSSWKSLTSSVASDVTAATIRRLHLETARGACVAGLVADPFGCVDFAVNAALETCIDEGIRQSVSERMKVRRYHPICAGMNRVTYFHIQSRSYYPTLTFRQHFSFPCDDSRLFGVSAVRLHARAITPAKAHRCNAWRVSSPRTARAPRR